MPETNRIEYKSPLYKEMDLEKEVVAFLNYREGGVIYIGIDKLVCPVKNRFRRAFKRLKTAKHE